MLYIGVDLGTSAVKLLLMNKEGKVLKTVSKSYPSYHPKSAYSEQDPNDWLTQTTEGIKELISGYKPEQISGIGFSGQMHGLVALDEHDKVIRRAILWNDGRCDAEVDYLNTVIGKERLSENTANIAFAGFTAPKILWMKKNEPESFKRIKKIMLPKDYLVYMLSGSFCTDVSDASGTLLMDVKGRCWSQEMLDICGIDSSCLPKIYESFDVVGTLKPQIADQLGILKNVKVIIGAADNAAAAIGTGTVGDGSCNISVGTSGTIFISCKDFRKDDRFALHSFSHADGTYNLLACMLSAASANKWWCDEILKTQNYTEEQSEIDTLGENNVFFLPYLMGERSPHNDTNARGAFVGMSMDTARKDMVQAVLEGVAFALRDSFEIAKSLNIEISSATICGGGAKSLLWKRIIANVLNIKLYTLQNEEGPAMGAAILAAVGCGDYENVKKATESIITYSDCIEPDENTVKKYQNKYKKFKKLYPALKCLYT